MKLLFQSRPEGGIVLSVAECATTEEADQFLAWFGQRTASGAPVPATPAAQPMTAPAPAQPPAEPPPVPTGVVPRPAKPITRADVSQVGMQLLQVKGRAAVEPILAMFGAKRLSEISEDRLYEAYYALKDEL